MIQREFGISQPAVSQNLKVLRDSGFAIVRPDGTLRCYAVARSAVRLAAGCWRQARREWSRSPAATRPTWPTSRDACTNPERIARWFLPVRGKLKEGGRYQPVGNEGGTITRCDPAARLRRHLGDGRRRQPDRAAFYTGAAT